MLRRCREALGLLLFASLFLVFVLQIGARFLFGLPLPWTDELAVVLYIWSILWAAAFLVEAKDHVAFDLVLQLLPAPWRIFLHRLGDLILGALALYALPASWDYVYFMRREGTPVLGIPFAAVFLPFLLLMIVLVWRGIRAVDHSWRDWWQHRATRQA